jgi:hypothetical protein
VFLPALGNSCCVVEILCEFTMLWKLGWFRKKKLHMYFKCCKKKGKEEEEGTTHHLRGPQAEVHGGGGLRLETVHKSREEEAEIEHRLWALCTPHSHVPQDVSSAWFSPSWVEAAEHWILPFVWKRKWPSLIRSETSQSWQPIQGSQLKGSLCSCCWGESCLMEASREAVGSWGPTSQLLVFCCSSTSGLSATVSFQPEPRIGEKVCTFVSGDMALGHDLMDRTQKTQAGGTTVNENTLCSQERVSHVRAPCTESKGTRSPKGQKPSNPCKGLQARGKHVVYKWVCSLNKQFPKEGRKVTQHEGIECH